MAGVGRRQCQKSWPEARGRSRRSSQTVPRFHSASIGRLPAPSLSFRDPRRAPGKGFVAACHGSFPAAPRSAPSSGRQSRFTEIGIPYHAIRLSHDRTTMLSCYAVIGLSCYRAMILLYRYRVIMASCFSSWHVFLGCVAASGVWCGGRLRVWFPLAGARRRHG